MKRVLPMWAHHTLIAVVALLIGACAGIVLAPDRSVHTLEYCKLDDSAGTPPCPPDTNRPVWAVWDGGVRAIAIYHNHAWHLQTPALGITRTTTPPTSWSEL